MLASTSSRSFSPSRTQPSSHSPHPFLPLTCVHSFLRACLLANTTCLPRLCLSLRRLKRADVGKTEAKKGFKNRLQGLLRTNIIEWSVKRVRGHHRITGSEQHLRTLGRVHPALSERENCMKSVRPPHFRVRENRVCRCLSSVPSVGPPPIRNPLPFPARLREVQ